MSTSATCVKGADAGKIADILTQRGELRRPCASAPKKSCRSIARHLSRAFAVTRDNPGILTQRGALDEDPASAPKNNSGSQRLGDVRRR